MKKTKKYIPIALLFAVGILITTSCRKEAGGKLPNDPVGLSTALDDAVIEQKILNFRQKCQFRKENPGLKSGEMISLPDASWLMEASLNFTYGNPCKTYEKLHSDSVEVQLNIQGFNGLVNFNVVSDAYYRLIDSLQTFYQSVSSSEKKIVLTDVKMTPSPNPEMLKLTMVSIVGEEQSPYNLTNNPFGDSDYWYYGYLQGKCGTFTGNNFGSDAGNEISKYQSWFKPETSPEYHIYYTDVETRFVSGNQFLNPNDPVPGDNMYDYLMFYNCPSQPNFHTCLSPDEMNFYFHSLYSIATIPGYVNPPIIPDGKSFMSANVYTAENYLNGCIGHNAMFKYGIAHYSYDNTYPITMGN